MDSFVAPAEDVQVNGCSAATPPPPGPLCLPKTPHRHTRTCCSALCAPQQESWQGQVGTHHALAWRSHGMKREQTHFDKVIRDL